jgi:hypothetical protein
MIQGFSYAFPVNLTVPVTMSALIVACGLRHDDPCFFHSSIPDYLFFDSPDVNFLNNFITKEASILSQFKTLYSNINLFLFFSSTFGYGYCGSCLKLG